MRLKKPEQVERERRRREYDRASGKRREYERRRRRQFRADALAAYGGQCVCCGESEPMFLELDHINNDGAQHRKEISNGAVYRGAGWALYVWLKIHDYPPGLQVLCANCHRAKTSYGGCPHQLSHAKLS